MLKQLVSSADGAVSSNRVSLLLIVCFVIGIGIFHAINDSLTDTWVMFLLGLIGAGYTGKVTQFHKEVKNDNVK